MRLTTRSAERAVLRKERAAAAREAAASVALDMARQRLLVDQRQDAHGATRLTQSRAMPAVATGLAELSEPV